MSQYPVFEPDDEVQVEELEPAPPANERSVARRLALQTLYEIDSAQHEADQVLARQFDEQTPPRQVARYAEKLVHGILDYQAELNTAIRQYAPDFPLDQIAIIDRNILRIALYEFAVSARVPVSVAINEAVELAKVFGAENTAAFINGVLGAVAEDADLVKSLHVKSDGDDEL